MKRPYVTLGEIDRDPAEEHHDAVELLVRDVLARYSGDLIRTLEEHSRKVLPLAAEMVMEKAYRPLPVPSEELRLLGVAEVAEFLGVVRQRVMQLSQQHPDFPEPVAVLRATTVWRAQDIERFERTWDRRPGRRSKKEKETET